MGISNYLARYAYEASPWTSSCRIYQKSNLRLSPVKLWWELTTQRLRTCFGKTCLTLIFLSLTEQFRQTTDIDIHQFHHSLGAYFFQNFCKMNIDFPRNSSMQPVMHHSGIDSDSDSNSGIMHHCIEHINNVLEYHWYDIFHHQYLALCQTWKITKQYWGNHDGYKMALHAFLSCTMTGGIGDQVFEITKCPQTKGVLTSAGWVSQWLADEGKKSSFSDRHWKRGIIGTNLVAF